MMNYLALLCRNSNIFLPGTPAHKPNEPRYISYARIGPRALRVVEPGGNKREYEVCRIAAGRRVGELLSTVLRPN